MQEFLFERARNSIADLRPRGPLRPDTSERWRYEWWPEWSTSSDDSTMCSVVERPDDLLVVVCGADSIPWAAVPGVGAPRRVRSDCRTGGDVNGPVVLIDPRSERRVPLAARSRPTEVRVGFLVNEASRNQGPDFYGYTLALEETLRRRLAVDDVVRRCKQVLSRPAGDEMLASFRECAGVVNGLAK
ncbi:MAG: hypothetical protein U0W40_19275 [Acidimicrobiia bacterium]